MGEATSRYRMFSRSAQYTKPSALWSRFTRTAVAKDCARLAKALISSSSSWVSALSWRSASRSSMSGSLRMSGTMFLCLILSAGSLCEQGLEVQKEIVRYDAEAVNHAVHDLLSGVLYA